MPLPHTFHLPTLIYITLIEQLQHLRHSPPEGRARPAPGVAVCTGEPVAACTGAGAAAGTGVEAGAGTAAALVGCCRAVRRRNGM